MLAYAYILTSEGYPCVFYRDYSTDRGCYGLRPLIDNLVWIHEKLASGPTVERWKEVGLFAYERVGGPRLLVALNKDDWQWRTITVDTGFGAHTKLHDYAGHGPDAWTDDNGRATISVPPNVNGLGYVCYSRDGQGFGFEAQSHEVTQTLEGAPDLDIAPAGAPGAATVAGRVYVAEGKRINVAMIRLDDNHFGAGASVVVNIVGPDRATLASSKFARAGTAPVHALAAHRGWHQITVEAHGTPAANPTPAFTLAVSYTAPVTLTPAELAAP
jgi:alpha-amylase